MARFCKNDRKDLYVQRKIFIINAIDQGVSATSKTVAVNNVPISVTLIARNPDADNALRKAITSFMITYDEIRENSKNAHERLYWFTEGIFTRSNTTQNSMYQKYMVFATLRSYVLASFQQITFKFGSILI